MGMVGKPTTEEGAQPHFCQGREGVGVCPGRGSAVGQCREGQARKGRAHLAWDRGGKERCLWQVQHRAAVKGGTGRGSFP